MRPTRACLAALLLLAAPGWARPFAPPGPPDGPASSSHPGVVLGHRARAAQSLQRVIPTVVIVSDPASYAAAIAAWDGLVRYPVLYDDGSDRAGETIGRFVRGFEPERVVRWAAGDAPAWPADREERQGRLVAAWTNAMATGDRAATTGEALALMKAAGYSPAGVVAVDPFDPAWVAGLALASGRLCPMVFIEGVEGTMDGAMSGEEADALAERIERATEELGIGWRSLGDKLDGLTLATNTPGRIARANGTKRDYLATTDRLGRLNAGGEGARWGWCGQVHGDEVLASYRAMCSLFGATERAWVFDGYPGIDPWTSFDGTEAGSTLASAGMTVAVHDLPENSGEDWRRATARGIDADVLLVNSKGHADFFTLNPGNLRAGDAPLLETPALLHMVHSFAFQRPDNPRTVGGRLLAHGVWAATGSVDEPYLQAFVPTPIVARRLASGMAWGAVGRQDAGPLWKIAVLGDPLFTLGPAPQRLAADLPLAGAEELDAARAAAVRDRDFALALRLLVMSGRDEDAARLASALLEHSPEEVTPDIAALAIGPLFRRGHHRAVLGAYAGLDEIRQGDPSLEDALWCAGRALLQGGAGAGVIETLDAHLREGQRAQDAIELGAHVSERSGREEAAAYLERAKARMSLDRQRQDLDKAIKGYRSARP